jgi:hypothetical protein
MPPVVKAPTNKAPWPPDPTRDPKGRTPIEVPVGSDPKQSFYTIAASKGLDPADLVRFNFGTTDPAQINWYLREYIGCFNTTRDEYNYTFYGAGTRPVGDTTKKKAVIYVPGPSAPPKPPGVTPLPVQPTDPSKLKFSGTFEYSFPEKPFSLAYATVVVTVSVSGKYAALKADSEGGITIGRDKVGVAVGTKISDSVGVAVTGELNKELYHKVREGAKKGPKGVMQALASAVEATVGKEFKVGAATVTIEGGATVSPTPFLVKVSGSGEEAFQISDGPGKPGPIPVYCTFTVQIVAKIGPNWAALGLSASEVAGGAGVGLLFVGFIAFGAWYGGRAAERGRLRGLWSWYRSGYVSMLFPSGILRPGPEMSQENDLFDRGQRDAQADADRMFAPKSGHEAILDYLRFMLVFVIERGHPPSTAPERAKQLLGDYITDRAKRRFNLDI